MLDTPVYDMKQKKLIKKYEDNNDLRSFMDEVNPIYNIAPFNEFDTRVPTVEQRKQIWEIAKKHAKSEDEVHVFIDYAKQLWEA